MGIGANIQMTRQTLGLTQEQLANAVGVSRQTVAKWEAGESSPDLEHAGALADVFDCTVDALVNFDSERTNLGVPPRGKHLFGSVKIGERGQIVIPKEARDIFDMQPGDKLVILGEDGKGIALCKESVFMAGMEVAMSIMQRNADGICQEKQRKKA